MKKILSFLAIAGITASALTGCVDDNQYVVAMGVTFSGSCDQSSTDQAYISSMTCDPSNTEGAALHIINHITGQVGWTSDSSSNGTTYEPQIPNAGNIFIESIVIKCDRVDGETSGCDGTDPIVIDMNMAVGGSGGGACIGFTPDMSIISSWGGDLVIDIYAKYHDASLIKGKSSHTKLNLKFAKDAGVCFHNAENDKQPVDPPTEP
ncbi:MAG: hypothetical protein IJM59_11025 [Proteobacteria bacterium]|nr:hypothetical protein [Pseudomonadota bacterium]